MPSVSVIIPHYERPVLLGQALSSVMAAAGPGCEVIVVDDGSTAAVWEEIQGFATDRVKVIRREEGRKGPSRCRNLGLACATGEFIVFLDSDDLLAPWCLEQRLACAALQPESDFWVFPVLLFSEHPGDSDVLWNRMGNGEEAAGRFAAANPPWHTSSPLWRRESLVRLGGFNEAVFYGDDSDLHMRALVGGLRFHLCGDEMPDAFVRRSDVPRITNSLPDALVESRLIRLREGTSFLKQTAAGRGYLAIWEGQYFQEAEFLLFNHPDPSAAVRGVLAQWKADFPGVSVRRVMARMYLMVAMAAKNRFYLLLRLARRLAMGLLPRIWFPGPGGDVRCAAGQLRKVQDCLKEAAGI